MNSRQLERILIVILLLLNLFLLGVVLSDTAAARRSDAEMTEELTALLEENGISVARGTSLLRAAPKRCTLTRDLQEEGRKIRRLLGDCKQEDLGGNIMFYRGDKGQAVLRGSGDTAIVFEGDEVRIRGGLEKTALRLMRRIGVSAVPADTPALAAQTEESVVLFCCVGGTPVYNALLKFDTAGQRIDLISGTRLFDSVTEKPDAEVMDSASALMRFLEIIRSEGFICSRLDEVQPGYLLSVTISGEGVLTPVWRIRTDTGELLIDAETGEVESRLS